MSSLSSHPAFRASSSLVIMFRTRRSPVLAMNRSSGLIGMFVFVLESHGCALLWASRRVLRSVRTRLLVQWRSMCLWDVRPVPQGHVVTGFIGVTSIMVKPARSREMEIVVRRGSCEFAAKGALVGRVVNCWFFCHLERQWWYSLFRSDDSVVLVQSHSSSFNPRFSSLSACSLPLMLTCDGVHFPLPSQPRCRKIFMSFRHALRYFLPTVSPPPRALSAFWLSTHKKIAWFAVSPFTSSFRPSCIACISPSSIFALLPIWHFPLNVGVLSGLVTQCQALLVIPSSFFDL